MAMITYALTNDGPQTMLELHLLRFIASRDTERFKDTNIIFKNTIQNTDGKLKARNLKFQSQEAASLMKG